MILVTGAHGVVGKPLCQRLQSEGRGFLAVSRAANCDELKWDLEQELVPSLQERISDCTTMIHCAPLWLLPVHLPAISLSGVSRIVAFSSTSVIAKRGSNDAHDQELVRQLRRAEQRLTQQADELGLTLTVLRPSMVYGYGRDQNVSHIAQQIKRIRVMPLAGKASGLRQPVHCDDLVDAALQAAGRDFCGQCEFNLAGAEVLSYKDMVTRIFAAIQLTPRFLHLPTAVYRGLLRVGSWVSRFDYQPGMANRMNQDLVYDNSAAIEALNFQPQVFLQHPQRDLPQ